MQAIQNSRPEIMESVSELIEEKEYKTWNSSLSFMLTIMVQFSLMLFGNNYYGLRMASVFAGLLVLTILLFMIIQSKSNKHQVLSLIVLGIFVNFDFSFLLASRIAEPSIFRMLLVLMVVYIFWKGNQRGKTYWFNLGIACVLAVTWGYVTNVFVFLPVVAILIYEKIYLKEKIVIKFFRFIGGTAIGLIASETTMYFVQKRTFLQDFSRTALQYGENRSTLTLYKIKDNIMDLLGSNLFGFNAILLIVTILSLISCLYFGFQNKDRLRVFCAFMLIGFILQNIVTSDFAARKVVVIFPIIILNILYLIENLYESSYKSNWKIRTYIFVISTIALYVVHWKIKRIPKDAMGSDMKTIILGLISGSVLLFLFLLCKETKKKCVLFILPVLLLQGILGYQYVWSQGETEKQAMIDLGSLVGKNYVLGFPYSYCLYNDIIPVSNAYDSYYEAEYIERCTELVKSGQVKYYLGYQGTDYIGRWIVNSDLGWREKSRFYTAFNVNVGNAEVYDIYLYECIEN